MYFNIEGIRVTSKFSGVATGGGVKEGQSAPLEKFAKKREKIRKKRKNWEGSFTLPLLTERADCATVQVPKRWWLSLLLL